MLAKRFHRPQLEHLAPVMDERTLATALNTENHTIEQWVTHGLPLPHERSRQSGKLIRIFDRELLIDWLFIMNKLYVSEWPEREAPFFIRNLRGQKRQLDKIIEQSAEVLRWLPGVMTTATCCRHLGIGMTTLVYWRDIHHLPMKKALYGKKRFRYLIYKAALINWLVRSRKNPALRRMKENVEEGRSDPAAPTAD